MYVGNWTIRQLQAFQPYYSEEEYSQAIKAVTVRVRAVAGTYFTNPGTGLSARVIRMSSDNDNRVLDLYGKRPRMEVF